MFEQAKFHQPAEFLEVFCLEFQEAFLHLECQFFHGSHVASEGWNSMPLATQQSADFHWFPFPYRVQQVSRAWERLWEAGVLNQGMWVTAAVGVGAVAVVCLPNSNLPKLEAMAQVKFYWLLPRDLDEVAIIEDDGDFRLQYHEVYRLTYGLSQSQIGESEVGYKIQEASWKLLWCQWAKQRSLFLSITLVCQRLCFIAPTLPCSLSTRTAHLNCI